MEEAMVEFWLTGQAAPQKADKHTAQPRM